MSYPDNLHMLSLFAYQHLPPSLQKVSKPFYDLACDMTAMLEDGPELSVALRKLVEAKDCAVRQRVIDLKNGYYDPPPVNDPEPELRQ